MVSQQLVRAAPEVDLGSSWASLGLSPGLSWSALEGFWASFGDSLSPSFGPLGRLLAAKTFSRNPATTILFQQFYEFLGLRGPSWEPPGAAPGVLLLLGGSWVVLRPKWSWVALGWLLGRHKWSWV